MFVSPVVETKSAHVILMDYASAITARKDNPDYSDNYKYDMPIPADVLQQANQYAPQLVATMRANVRRMARHQSTGSLDTSKLVRLARPSSASQFDRDASIAFRRRADLLNEVPLKLAVVADMNYEIRYANKRYVEMVTTLTFILADAAACAGLTCAAYGVRGKLGYPPADLFPNRGNKPCSFISVLAEYGKRVAPPVFQAHVQHQPYINIYYACTDQSTGSQNGTGGIDYARDHDGATFIVGVGNFDDVSRPDVQLQPGTSIAAAVAKIHAALGARQQKAA